MERLTWCEHLLGKLPARSDLAELFSPLSTLFYNTITSASAQVVALEVEKYPVQDHDQAAISPEDKCQDQSLAPAPDQALVPALAEADQGTRFEKMSYSFSLDCNNFRAGFGVQIVPSSQAHLSMQKS